MKLHEGKYLHGEAFMLMNYASDDGKVKEVLWNSRDGVTPFCLNSVDDMEMRHVDWQHDIRSTLHVPEVGSRMFIDLTKDRMLECKRRYVDVYWEGEYSMKDHPELGPLGKEGAALSLAYSEWQDHEPDVVVVTQQIVDKLLTKRARELLPKNSRRNPPRAG